jgi:hypothetical protein
MKAFVVAMAASVATSSSALAEEQPLGVEPDAVPEWGIEGPYALDLAATIGWGYRLDDPPLYQLDERSGMSLGAELGIALSRRVRLALAYETIGLGREDSGVVDTGVVAVDRRLHAGWFTLRLVPLDFGPVDLHATIGLGIGSEQTSLDASLWSATEPGRHVDYQCGASGSPGFGVRAGLGADFRLGAGFFISLDARLSNMRLDDELIDECAPGAGTLTIFSLDSALGYRWDL